jgi:hypothetical protein
MEKVLSLPHSHTCTHTHTQSPPPSCLLSPCSQMQDGVRTDEMAELQQAYDDTHKHTHTWFPALFSASASPPRSQMQDGVRTDEMAELQQAYDEANAKLLAAEETIERRDVEIRELKAQVGGLAVEVGSVRVA